MFSSAATNEEWWIQFADFVLIDRLKGGRRVLSNDRTAPKRSLSPALDVSQVWLFQQLPARQRKWRLWNEDSNLIYLKCSKSLRHPMSKTNRKRRFPKETEGEGKIDVPIKKSHKTDSWRSLLDGANTRSWGEAGRGKWGGLLLPDREPVKASDKILSNLRSPRIVGDIIARLWWSCRQLVMVVKSIESASSRL